MNNHIRKKFFYLVLGLIILSNIVTLAHGSKPARAPLGPVPQKPTVVQPSVQLTATLEVGTVRAQLSFAHGETLYAALEHARTNGMIAFSGRNYPSLGYFVTSIGSLQENGNKHLIYYVNGKEASVGISSYVLEPGDQVVWKLE